MISMSSHTVPSLVPDILPGDSMIQEWRQISAGPNHRLLFEYSENPTQDQDGPHLIETGAGGDKRTEVFDHLEPG